MKDLHLDVVAPRCAKCNEPVSLNKRDCLCTRAREKGTQMAKNVFDKRSKRGWRNAEAHLSEVELAALLTVAYEAGAKDKYRAKVSVLERLVRLAAVNDPRAAREARAYLESSES